MSKSRRLITNFSKGELSPKLEGRPDLAAYFEGGKTIENFVIMRQGGLDRRLGTAFIQEVKDSSRDTILIPFEASVNDAFIIEVGHLYMRFYKNKAPILTAGVPVEITSPYTEAQLREIHFTQSVDVLFLFHPDVPQRRLSRISDTSWTLSTITYKPPPAFEADTDISGGTATLTPSAITGTGVTFTASSAVFLAADKGRLIVFGASRATITVVDVGLAVVTADIIDDFPNTNPIAAGSWLLRLSPQTTLDPNIKEPIGGQVTLVSGLNAFRTADVGKFIAIYGGLVRITIRDSAIQVKGEILSVMVGTNVADPPAAAAGAWTLEVASWSTTNGFPRTGEFFQGRLGQASTKKQPTTWWLSTPDDFDNYAVGASADRAVEYTIASRQLNRIEWITDNKDLFIGTAGVEFRAQGGRSDEPIGGDSIPLTRRLTTHGSAPIQSNIINKRIIFVDRSRKKIISMAFDIEQDDFDALELTGAAEHILGTGARLGPISLVRQRDPRVYFVREDGTLVVLTYFYHEKVIGFTRLTTDGTFESVAAIPHVQDLHGAGDEVWTIVKRTINNQTKRYVEVFEDHHAGLLTRSWTSLQTDSAKVYSGAPTTIITGLSHLEGKTVSIIADNGSRGTKVVSGGQITLSEEVSIAEIGLKYDSKVVTMRPAVENTVIEGLPRSWDKLWVRLVDTIGGHVNGEPIQYTPSSLGALSLFTGDREVTGQGWDTDGRVTIEQREPYPMTLLAMFGTLSLGDHD